MEIDRNCSSVHNNLFFLTLHIEGMGEGDVSWRLWVAMISKSLAKMSDYIEHQEVFFVGGLVDSIILFNETFP